MDWMTWGSNSGREMGLSRFIVQNAQTGFGAPPSSYSLGIGGGGSFPGVKWPELGADQLSSTTILRISRDIPLFSYKPSWCVQGQLQL
jgi:hypothetical protein